MENTEIMGGKDGSMLGKYIRLKDACRLFPGKDGKKLSVATIYRWALYGVRGVKLQVHQVGSTLCTTQEWAEAFVEQATRKRLERLGLSQEPQEVNRGAERAGRELDRIGI